MTTTLETQLATDWPPPTWSDVTVLLAVSGGVDSVALARALAAVREPGPGRLIVAHFNHRLRGAESDADEAFVIELAGRIDLPCITAQAESVQETSPSSLFEEHARDDRYRFFRQTADQFGARYLVTAHTADDQAETILHRIVRGTGIAGLAGIPRVRPLTPACTLVRPLLCATRADVIAYLTAIDQAYRVDATNASLHATRNRIRHELLPHLAETYNPQVRAALLQLGQLAGEAQQVVNQLVARLAEGRARAVGEGGFELDCRGLAAEPRYVVRELLVQTWREHGFAEQSMGFAEWQSLADLAMQADIEPSQRVLPGGVVCQRVGDRLRCQRSPAR